MVDVLSDVPGRLARLSGRAVRCVMRNGEERTYTVRGVRPGSGGAATLVRFEEFDDRTFAQSLAGMVLTVPACDAPELPAGQYYVHQIEGLRVRSDDGRDLGVIAEVMQPGANDVYVVDGPLGELLIPAIPDVVQRVDLSEGVMVVHCPPGLLPDDTAR